MNLQKGWNLDLSAWQLLASLLQDLNWKSVPLASDSRQLVPPDPGVYVMCVGLRWLPISGGLFDRLSNAIYVGQSRDLRLRFSQHVHGDRRKVTQALLTFRSIEFHYAVAPLTQLSVIEQALIEALGPSAHERNQTRASLGSAITAKVGDAIALRGER